MIWYDVVTKQPVAPGGCEDAGVPSIDGYTCQKCSNHVEPVWETNEVRVDTQLKPIMQFGIGVCPMCGYIMLTTLL